jgi:hypothetical protein
MGKRIEPKVCDTISGVKSAGAESGGGSVFFEAQGQPPIAPGQEPTAAYKIVTPDFFQAMGTRLVAGREFSARDTEGATPVAIISETVAQRYWPHANPVAAISRFWRGSTRARNRGRSASRTRRGGEGRQER